MNSIISLETLFQKFTEKEGVIIDIRDRDEYLRAHIPGSINIPWNDIPKVYKSIPNKENIYIISQDGSKSIGMAQVLKLKRIEARAVSPGGIEKWNKLGFPLISQ